MLDYNNNETMKFAQLYLEEVGIKLWCDRPGEECLASARRPVQQAALGRGDAHALKQLWVHQRQLNNLHRKWKQFVSFYAISNTV